MNTTLIAQLFEKEGFISAQPLAGGDINRVFQVRCTYSDFVIKLNSARKFPLMFEREKEGLDLLANHSEFRVPKVKEVGRVGDEAYLIMEYISPARLYPHEEAGRLLARMHKHSNDQFGLATSNYIGSLVQENQFTPGWTNFFIEQRIEPLLKRAFHYFDEQETKQFNLIFNKLDEFFPQHKPALLHGDLWSGNTFASSKNEPVLIDPAVYFGHPYMDLGMTQLFGGYSPEFYSAYHEVKPLSPEWNEGAQIANLYPLLVHLNLFGASYKNQISSVLRSYA